MITPFLNLWSRGQECDYLFAAYDKHFSICCEPAVSYSADPVGRFTSEIMGRSSQRGELCLAESCFAVIPVHTTLFSNGCFEFFSSSVIRITRKEGACSELSLEIS